MNNKLLGTGVALVTPFKQNLEVDYVALDKIIDHLISQGIDYLVVFGTTGESVTLTKAEKKEVLAHLIAKVSGRLPLVLGVGGNHTRELLDQLGEMDPAGLAAILSVSPYYNKPQQSGIYAHYKALAAASPLPLVLYNVPGRTGSNMSAETTLRLASDFPNIIGIKEASGNLVQVMEIIKNKPPDFMLISGDDILTLPMIAMGACGVISVTAQAVPGPFSTMVRLAMQGELEKARQLHYEMQDLMNALFADGSPGGIKAALHLLGLCQNVLRLPLVGVNEAVYRHLSSILGKG